MKKVPQQLWQLLKSPTITIMLLLLYQTSFTNACPRDCHCFHRNNGTSVNCRNKQLLALPNGIPADAFELDLSDNMLTDVSTGSTLEYYTNVKKLLVGFNKIQILYSNFFASFPNLEEISLESNVVVDIEQGAFNGLTKLNYLYLQGNQIQILNASAFENLDLKVLNLEQNYITNVNPSSFDSCKVESLYMDYNDISSLTTETFSPLKNTLKRLYISYNKRPLQVDQQTFSGFQFNDLSLCYNGITDCSFLSTLNVHRLDLTGNRIHIASLANYPNLMQVEELILVNNSILALDTGYFQHMTNLKSLDLSKNKLTEIKSDIFLENILLQKLLLNDNYLSKFPDNIGQFCPNLKQLMLASNQIKNVDSNSFHSLKKLQELDLSYNNIQIFPNNLESIFNSIQVLSLASNPIHCNCEMLWFYYWLQNRITFTGVDGCASPHRRGVNEWTTDDFVCTPPVIIYMTQSVNVSDGEDLLLQCTAEGDPAPRIDFTDPFNEGISISPQPNRTNTKTYAMWQVNRIPTHKAGFYTCSATNIAGAVDGTICVRVISDIGDAAENACLQPTTTANLSPSTYTTRTTTASKPTTEPPLHTVSKSSPVSTSQSISPTMTNPSEGVTNGGNTNTTSSVQSHTLIIILAAIALVVVVIAIVICVVHHIKRRRVIGRYSISHKEADILEYHKMNGHAPTDKFCNGQALL